MSLYYNGYTFKEISQLPINFAISLLELAVQKEAKNNLLRLNMMDYPNMKKEDRRKLFKAIKSIAQPVSALPMKTTKDLVGFLNG